ncbi:MAG: hypothetical protein CVV39_08425 [Planctomycetes bacterium HGW-Planctomycetes-1]|nr:MAG: hypothetical protein CVV39_08425 [Planctomycetes bacterium HGW-Planctomycetes-1]
MNLVYIDDTGNTGLNLKDNQQPIFVLVSIIIHSSKWFAMEKEFYDILKGYFGKELPEDFELKAVNLRSGANHFKGLSMESRLAIRDSMLELLLKYEIPLIYRRIIKSKFEVFCEKQYGPGIKINPYVMALPFVCMEIDNYLKQKTPAELGMLIFDEQKESFNEAEKSLKTLRLDPKSHLKTTNLIEKGFFVDSKKSFALQLTDIVAFYARKYEEYKLNKPVSNLDKQTFDTLKRLIPEGIQTKIEDIHEWIKQNYIK